MEFNKKNPIIHPPVAHITRLFDEDYHIRLGHYGMAHTWTSVRQHCWIIKGAVALCKILGKCLLRSCRNAHVGKQLMANLAEGRVTPCNPPFFQAEVEFFGLLYVGQGRSTL